MPDNARSLSESLENADLLGFGTLRADDAGDSSASDRSVAAKVGKPGIETGARRSLTAKVGKPISPRRTATAKVGKPPPIGPISR